MRKKTVIPDAPVRIKILKALITKSYPLHFTEIRELIQKHDAVTGRELKILVEAGLVIKNPEGLYSVNKYSKEHADFFIQLALNEDSTRYHYLMDYIGIFVFIACDELDAGLIEIKDFDKFKDYNFDDFMESVKKLILGKVFAIRERVINRCVQERIPAQESLAIWRKIMKETGKNPLKIMITFNMPFFKSVFEEEM